MKLGYTALIPLTATTLFQSETNHILKQHNNTLKYMLICYISSRYNNGTIYAFPLQIAKFCPTPTDGENSSSCNMRITSGQII